MMKALWALTILTVREEFRRKTLYFLFFLVPGLSLLSLCFSQLTPGSEKSFTVDATLSALTYVSAALCVILTSDIIHREFERGTIYTYVTNPVYSTTLMLGKWFGVNLVLLMVTAAVSIFSLGLTLFKYHTPDLILQKTILLSYGQVLILTAFGVMGSVILSKYTNILTTFILFFTGSSAEITGHLSEHSGLMGFKFVKYIFIFFPDLTIYDAKNWAVLDEDFAWIRIIHAYAMAIVYCIFFLVLSTFFLRRRFR